MKREKPVRRAPLWPANVRPGRVASPAICAALVLTAAGQAGVDPAVTAARSRSAHAAHTISVKDEAKVHLLHSSGSTLTEEGPATGTIPGQVKLSFTYNGSPVVSASFTIAGSHGSIRVRASGRLSSPTVAKPSFKGTISVTGGSGRYARARGHGSLYGVFNRRSYAIVVQAVGTITY